MKRLIVLAVPFVLAAGLGVSAATSGSANPLTPVLVDTATVAPAADGSVTVPGVVSAVVLPSAANQVRLGSVTLNGKSILDAASLDCTGAHPALLLAPTAGVVLPSVPSVGTQVNVPGVGLLTLNGETPGDKVAYVTGISATVNGHTVNLLNGTCTQADAVSTSRVATTQPGTGTIGVEVQVTAAATATPVATTGTASPPASPADAPATLPSRLPAQPGEAPAPSPVPGAGGVTG